MFNLTYANIIFRTRIARITRIFKIATRYVLEWDSGDYFPLVSGSSTNLVVKNQPQAVTLANPSEIPMHRKKTKVKKIRVKDSVASVIIRERFLTFVL